MKQKGLTSQMVVLFGILLFPGVGLFGCSENAARPFDAPRDCNPIAAEWDCLLPFPSDVFLTEDSSLPSGYRVSIPEKAKLVRPDGKTVDFTEAHSADGFSRLSQILALIPFELDGAQLLFHTDDVQKSLSISNSTLLIDAEQKELVLHFAELDPLASESTRRSLLIRPLVPLRNAARYIVVIQHLNTSQKEPIPVPDGFLRIRDRVDFRVAGLQDLAEHYEANVFPILDQLGLERKHLLLAWDFTTQTEAHVTADLFTIREKVIERFSRENPVVEIVETREAIHEHIARKIEGRMQVPLFLDSTAPDGKLRYDDQQRVTSIEDVWVPFTVLIPTSLANRKDEDPKGRVFQYGHGFFSQRNRQEEIQALYPFLDRFGFVYVACDWWGVAFDDLADVVNRFAYEPSAFLLFTDRLHQAMANALVLAYAIKGALAEQPALFCGSSSCYHPDPLYFYGISMGHFLGSTYLALSPLVDRAVLSVGGAGLSFIMFRALSFGPLLEFIRFYVKDPVDIQKIMALSQTTFDRIDPITYGPYILTNTLAGSPPSRNILVQIGIGDAYMPNLASHLQARALGLKVLEPLPRPIVGLDSVSAPFQGSAMMEFDFGLTPPLAGTYANPLQKEAGVHKRLRTLESAMRQIDRFFTPNGPIIYPCENLCNPE